MTTEVRRRAPRVDLDAILQAATAEFAERGYEDTSLGEVAQRARTSRPTLYARFGSKDDLYRTCLERAAERLTGALFATYESVAPLPAAEQVRADIQAFFDFARENSAEFSIIFADRNVDPAAAVRSKVVARIVSQIEGVTDTIVTRSGRAPDAVAVDLLAEAVVGACVGVARRADAQALDILAGDLTFELLWSGLSGLPAGRMTSQAD